MSSSMFFAHSHFRGRHYNIGCAQPDTLRPRPACFTFFTLLIRRSIGVEPKLLLENSLIKILAWWGRSLKGQWHVILSVFKKSKLGSVFQKVQQLRPTWTAGVLIVSRSVLAVNASVQGFFISVCVLYFKGRVYHFLSFKIVSSRIIGCLSPVIWGTHGSEVPLTTFYHFLIYTCIIFF